MQEQQRFETKHMVIEMKVYNLIKLSFISDF